MHELASCFCPYRLYPHDTLCTYGAKQLKLLQLAFFSPPVPFVNDKYIREKVQVY